MVSPIYINKDFGGLGQGILQAGTALGQALQRSGMREYELGKEEKKLARNRYAGTILQNALEKVNKNPTLENVQNARADVISRGVDPNLVNQYFSPYDKLFSEQEKARLQRKYMEDLGLLPPEQTNMNEPISPISDVTNFQRNLPPEQRPSPNELTDTIKGPQGQEFDQSRIDAMIASPYENIRRLGESYQNRLNEIRTSQMKENVEIRKEERGKINKYMEPLRDISKLQQNYNRLQQVNRIIEEEPLSFDDKVWRNISVGLLEDKNKLAMAEILKTPAQQKLYALLRPYFGIKEIGGSNPSTREVLLSMQTLPGGLKSKEVNKYIGQMLLGEAENLLNKAKFANDISKNKYVSFNDFQDKLNEKLSPLMEKTTEKLENLRNLQTSLQKVKRMTPTAGYNIMLSPRGEIVETRISDEKKALKDNFIMLKKGYSESLHRSIYKYEQ